MAAPTQSVDCAMPAEVKAAIVSPGGVIQLNAQRVWPEVWWSWIETTASSGCERSLDHLKLFYIQNTERFAKEPALGQRARQVISQVLDHGHPDDQWSDFMVRTIASQYRRGEAGLPKDAAEAVRWNLRSAERNGVVGVDNAALIYKQGTTGVPRDDLKAEQLLQQYLASQRDFYEKHPEHALDSMYGHAEAGFSSQAFRLVEVFSKGLLGVKPNPEAASRWKRVAEDARWTETHNGEAPPQRPAPKPDGRDAQCAIDVQPEIAAFEEKQAKGMSPVRLTYTTHFNRKLKLCLASAVFHFDPPRPGFTAEEMGKEPSRMLLGVGVKGDVAIYLPSRSQPTPFHCRTRSIRLREDFELRDASCESLADYQRFVDWAMRE